MLGEIIVTSPQNEVTQLVKQIGSQLDLKITVLESALDDAVSLVKNLLSQNPDRYWVVISRGATLKLLAQEILSVPLIGIDPTGYDIVTALYQAKNLGDEIGVLVSDPSRLDQFFEVSKILGIRLKVYVYTNGQDFLVQVEKARRDGITVLVGGGQKGAVFAQDRKIQHVPLLAGEVTVRLALQRAKEIMETARREKESAEHLKAIVAYSHEGIIAVNQDGIFSVFNPDACRLFNLDETDVVGRPLKDLAFRRSLIEMFEGPLKNLGFIHRTRDAVLLVNKVPLIFSGNSQGTLVTFKEISKIQEEESKVRREIFAKGLVAKYSFNDIVHVSRKMSDVIAKAERFAKTNSTVLIRGDSGTGKELIAQSIHNGHPTRCKRPFVAVNCAALDDHLLKSELFGYAEGSFTGAIKGGKPGLFEIAHGGTLFLDEIGKIKLDLQANLLRVLQEKEVRRIGSDRVVPVDVRVVAASNEDLLELIKNGSFREDLYFRLNVLALLLPSLRERREDIPHLVTIMLAKFSKQYDKEILSLPTILLRQMADLDWPGNVRQLENIVERCVVLSENDQDAPEIMSELLHMEFKTLPNEQSFIDLTERIVAENHISVHIGTLQEMESEIVRKLSSEEYKLNKSKLAEKLGISRPTLSRLLNI